MRIKELFSVVPVWLLVGAMTAVFFVVALVCAVPVMVAVLLAELVSGKKILLTEGRGCPDISKA